MKALRESGMTISNIHSGIYRFEGKISIPVQLVVSSQLPVREYEGLKLLAKGITIDDIIRYAERAVASGNDNIKENAGTVIEISLSVNKELSKQLKEAENMNAAVRDVLQDIFEDRFDQIRQEEKERVAVDMLRENYPITAIEKISKLPETVIRTIAASINVQLI